MKILKIYIFLLVLMAVSAPAVLFGMKGVVRQTERVVPEFVIKQFKCHHSSYYLLHIEGGRLLVFDKRTASFRAYLFKNPIFKIFTVKKSDQICVVLSGTENAYRLICLSDESVSILSIAQFLQMVDTFCLFKEEGMLFRKSPSGKYIYSTFLGEKKKALFILKNGDESFLRQIELPMTLRKEYVSIAFEEGDRRVVVVDGSTAYIYFVNAIDYACIVKDAPQPRIMATIQKTATLTSNSEQLISGKELVVKTFSVQNSIQNMETRNVSQQLSAYPVPKVRMLPRIKALGEPVQEKREYYNPQQKRYQIYLPCNDGQQVGAKRGRENNGNNLYPKKIIKR